MTLWPGSMPLCNMMESLLANSGVNQISKDTGWHFEAVVWRFYVQTIFDCCCHVPILPVLMKVLHEGLTWGCRGAESLTIAHYAHI